VYAPRGPRKDFHRHAGKPLQQINTMDGLVDERATAVFGQLALPARVVLLRAIPLHVAARQHHAPETVGVDRGLELPRAVTESRLEDGPDAHPMFFRFVQDVIGAFDGGIERLLDHQMFARADRGKRRFEMQRRRRGDADGIESGLLQQRVHVIGGEANAMFARELLGRAARSARHPHQPSALRGRDPTRMKMRDGAGADEPESDRLLRRGHQSANASGML
jgi:hypothetical protein